MKIIKPDYQWNGSLIPLDPRNVEGTIIHHMAHEKWDYMDVHNSHKNTNKWLGIGYNYFIRLNGDIIEGRGFNQGAHCSGYNDTYIGIGFQGDFERGDQKPTEEQINSAIWLINNVLSLKFHKAKNVFGHKEKGSTACPGKRFPLGEFKRRVLNNEMSKDQPSSWAKNSWEKAITAGIMNEGQGPKDPLTREQLAVILDRLGFLK